MPETTITEATETIPEIIIDEEFRSILPALDKETFALLEENLLVHGCMHPLILWENILIDGHNRYEIATRHGIPFATVTKEFASRDEVLIWIISTHGVEEELKSHAAQLFPRFALQGG